MSDPQDPSATTPAPDVMQAIPMTPPEGVEQEESITQPAKLLRIASMVRELLEETRQASLDEAGRKRLADIYQRSVDELSEVLSADLQEELAQLAPPLEGVPTESEIRVAQAQLVGWLEGLFHGIQAAMFAQQAAARAQFEELRAADCLAQNPHARRADGRRPGRPTARPIPLGGPRTDGLRRWPRGPPPPASLMRDVDRDDRDRAAPRSRPRRPRVGSNGLRDVR